MPTIDETNVTIMVKDLDQSIQFYESLGLALKNRWENHYAMITATGITIGLHPSELKERNSGTVSVGFVVNSFTEAADLLKKLGIPYNSDEGKSGKYLHFKDPDGTILYFVEPKWR